MADARSVLNEALARATKARRISLVSDIPLHTDIEYVVGHRIQSPTKALMACTLHAVMDPAVDIRKPYTALGAGSYSGRATEIPLDDFVAQNRLPTSARSGFLAPAFRDNRALTLDLAIAARSEEKRCYDAFLRILDRIARMEAQPATVLAEVVRLLVLRRDVQKAALDTIAASRPVSAGSVEGIVRLLREHFGQATAGAARLPVLAVAAAYETASTLKVRPLGRHNSSDRASTSAGDIEMEYEGVLALAVESKAKAVTNADVDLALEKAVKAGIDAYIITTTVPVNAGVWKYARGACEEMGNRVDLRYVEAVSLIESLLAAAPHRKAAFLAAYERRLREDRDVPAALAAWWLERIRAAA